HIAPHALSRQDDQSIITKHLPVTDRGARRRLLFARSPTRLVPGRLVERRSTAGSRSDCRATGPGVLRTDWSLARDFCRPHLDRAQARECRDVYALRRDRIRSAAPRQWLGPRWSLVREQASDRR